MSSMLLAPQLTTEISACARARVGSVPMALMMMMAGSEAYAGSAVVGRPALSSVSMTAITPGDIGTTKPLGIYDPLGLMTSMPDKYRRCASARAPSPLM
jgi:hypothetical protein